MKFLGNYRDFIDPNWLPTLLSLRGDGRPKEGAKPSDDDTRAEYAKAIAAGYDPETVYFWMFDKNNTPFDIPKPPFITDKFHWWFTKMLPGNFMPLHIDPHTLNQNNSQRFWFPLQDWEPGHIFMYENQVITNYKAGDVWTYENSNAVHGAANIGYTPRVVLQISGYS
jgi:hypothetical protein